MPESKKVSIPKLYTRAKVDIASVDDAEKSFEVVFATETPVYRASWEENFNEIISCNKESIRGERFSSGSAPLLDAHSRWSINDVLGRVDSWSIKNNECRAKIIFSTQEKFAGLWGDIKAGIFRSVSCGYKVWKYIREPMAEGQVPNYRAVDWEPFEISLAPVPADFNSQISSNSVRAADEKEVNEVEIILNSNNQKTRSMSEVTTTVVEPVVTTQQRTDQGATVAAPAVILPAPMDENKVRTDAVAGERKRATDIYTACSNAKLERSFADDLISRGVTIEVGREEIINKMAETDTSIRTVGPSVKPGEDEGDKTRTAMEDGLIHRALPGSIELKDKAHDYRYSSMLDLAKRCLEIKGQRVIGSNSELVKRAIATTDYPNLLTNVTKRIIRKEYEKIARPWEFLGEKKSAPDFRAINATRLNASTTFEEIPEGGEYKEAIMINDENATMKLKTYGRKIAITRQAIINDDMGVFNKKPKLLAQGAAAFQAAKVWALITSNAKTPDGKPLFHADHGNLATGADKGPPNKATLSKARIMLGRQKTPSGDLLNVHPTQIIVPLELLTETEILMGGTINPTDLTQVNPFYKKFTIVSDPFLTDVNAWYLIDPDMEGVVYAYLSGEEGLHTESQINFDNDVVETKARLDFDAALWGYYGFYKNPGV